MSKWISENDLLVNIVQKSRYTSKTIVEAIDESQRIELVRCRDCKHRKKYNGEYHRCSVFERTIKNDDYCSFGERGDSE